MIKVHHGTPDHSTPSLCYSCRESQVVRNAKGDTRVFCHSRAATPTLEIREPITDCNDYQDKTTTPLWEMEKIAWRFNKDDKRKIAGFLDPKSFKAKFPDED